MAKTVTLADIRTYISGEVPLDSRDFGRWRKKLLAMIDKIDGLETKS